MLLYRLVFVIVRYIETSEFLFLFTKIRLQDSNPVLVAFSEQMQAIVGIIRVHILGSRDYELREEVDVGQAAAVGDVLDQGVWAMASAFWLSVKNYLKIRVVSLSLSNSS